MHVDYVEANAFCVYHGMGAEAAHQYTFPCMFGLGKLHIAMHASGEIEADWLLLNTCNFRCGYCYLDPALLREKLVWLPSAASWIAAFAATDRRWLLNVTGGEPSLYPELRSLLAGLEPFCRFSFNTNLHDARFVDALCALRPESVSIVHVGLHDAERQRRGDAGDLMRLVNSLAASGFPVLVSCVATPEVIRRFPMLAEQFSELVVRPMLKLLQGPYRGRLYPQAYTEAERAQLQVYVEWAGTSYAAIGARPAGKPTVWVPDEISRGWAQRDYSGRNCRAGRDFVRIQPDGDVHRCGENVPLGNLLKGTFGFDPMPKPCRSAYCNHFCEKYVLPLRPDIKPPRVGRGTATQ